MPKRVEGFIVLGGFDRIKMGLRAKHKKERKEGRKGER